MRVGRRCCCCREWRRAPRPHWTVDTASNTGCDSCGPLLLCSSSSAAGRPPRATAGRPALLPLHATPSLLRPGQRSPLPLPTTEPLRGQNSELFKRNSAHCCRPSSPCHPCSCGARTVRPHRRNALATVGAHRLHGAAALRPPRMDVVVALRSLSHSPTPQACAHKAGVGVVSVDGVAPTATLRTRRETGLLVCGSPASSLRFLPSLGTVCEEGLCVFLDPWLLRPFRFLHPCCAPASLPHHGTRCS